MRSPELIRLAQRRTLAMSEWKDGPMESEDSRPEGQARSRVGRVAEWRKLRKQRKIERDARRLSSDPGGQWSRQRGAGGGGGPT